MSNTHQKLSIQCVKINLITWTNASMQTFSLLSYEHLGSVILNKHVVMDSVALVSWHVYQIIGRSLDRLLCSSPARQTFSETHTCNQNRVTVITSQWLIQFNTKLRYDQEHINEVISYLRDHFDFPQLQTHWLCASYPTFQTWSKAFLFGEELTQSLHSRLKNSYKFEIKLEKFACCNTESVLQISCKHSARPCNLHPAFGGGGPSLTPSWLRLVQPLSNGAFAGRTGFIATEKVVGFESSSFSSSRFTSVRKVATSLSFAHGRLLGQNVRSASVIGAGLDAPISCILSDKPGNFIRAMPKQSFSLLEFTLHALCTYLNVSTLQKIAIN